jgi:hypothetical protein
MLAERASFDMTLRDPPRDGLSLGLIPYGFVFGCPNLHYLKSWFLLGRSRAENFEIVKTLKSMGFRIAEFLVAADGCRFGHSGVQLAFDAPTCKEEGAVRYHDLDILLSDFPHLFVKKSDNSNSK